MANTLRDNLRDIIVDHRIEDVEVDLAGEIALLEAICEEIKDFISNEVD